MIDPLASYQAMNAAARRQVLLCEYRCRVKGCLLLHVWQSPHGRYWYTPPYVLSAQVTHDETAESARVKRTCDGYRRWLSRAGSFDELVDFFDGVPAAGGISVTCDHVRHTLTIGRLAADVGGATPGSPAKGFVPD
jgi:hypothetical protein